MENLSFNWNEPFDEFPGDTLERSRYAKFLTSFLAEKGKADNYVLNVNASWGTGKTWFLRRWVNEIKDTCPTVYIDAWKNDHSRDPFLAVISEIRTYLIKNTDKNFIESNGFKKTWMLMKSIAPVVAKEVIKKKLGVDIDAMDESLLSGDGVADIGEKLVEAMISSHEETSQSIEDFKTSISSWLDAVVAQGKYKYPLFVFVDELDRCRPTYAIEMLETIKHIFDLKNVVFVVATDRQQLQHSVRAIYGEGFDSERYLERFFRRSVTLRQPSTNQFIYRYLINSAIFNNYVSDEGNFCFNSIMINRLDDTVNILSYLADEFKMEPRTILKWLERIEAVLIAMNYKVEIISFGFMLGLYSHEPQLYSAIQSGLQIFTPNDKAYIGHRFNRKLQFNWSNNIDFDVFSVQVHAAWHGVLNGDKSVEFSFREYIDYTFKLLRKRDSEVENYDESIVALLNVVRQKNIIMESDMPNETAVLNSQSYKVPLLFKSAIVKFLDIDGMNFRKYLDLCELATTLD